MALTKKFLKSKPVCKVTFKLAKDVANGGAVFLVGDFNAWDRQATPMKKAKTGELSTSLDLETGRDYQYKYLILDGDNAERWVNDDNADRYQRSDFAGADNSVICL